MKPRFLIRVLAACTLALAGQAFAQEVTLKAVNAFQEGTFFAVEFEAFVKKVNEEGKGLVQIQYVGGPKAIPTMEQGAALRNGVVDMAHTTGAYTASIVPEVLALNYATKSWAELRKNGAVDYLNSLMAPKGLIYWARTGDQVRYHIYLTKKIDKPDLKGMKIRIAPLFREFFTQMGATVVQTAPGEVYAALERGVVDGYGWPLLGIFDSGWQNLTKFRVEPGFYMLELGIQFNAKSWERLNPQQKAFLEKQRDWLEKRAIDNMIASANDQIARQKAAGIQEIRFSPAETAAYLKLSQDAAWEGVIKTSPQTGPRLRQLLTN